MMGRSVAIICNGDFPKKAYPLYLLQMADFIICCDGAAEAYLRHAARSAAVAEAEGRSRGETPASRKAFAYLSASATGDADDSQASADMQSCCPIRLPDVVIGDLDSLKPSLAKKLGERVVRVEEQETNDLAKAFRYVLDNVKDTSRITVIGASGKREDHTIGNLSLLMEFAEAFESRDIAVEAVSDYSTAFAMTDSGEIHCGEGRSVSIFSCDPTLRIKSTGLTWPTDQAPFTNWWQATLNKASDDIVHLQFSHPSPVLIVLN